MKERVSLCCPDWYYPLRDPRISLAAPFAINICRLCSRGSLFQTFTDTIALGIVVCPDLPVLVFGELVPKYIGLSNKEKVSIFIVPLFDFVSRFFFVLVNILSFSTMFFVKGLNLKHGEEHVGEGEIKILLEEGRRKGVFDRTEEELIHGVFQFADRSVKEIMVPKPNVYAIDVEDSKDKVLEYIIENEFSRYPVFKDSFDNIIGIVYHKEITKHGRKDPFKLRRYSKTFRSETVNQHPSQGDAEDPPAPAVVIDEYKTTVGIATLEDIMERSSVRSMKRILKIIERLVTVMSSIHRIQYGPERTPAN
jgi:putative hemolysin